MKYPADPPLPSYPRQSVDVSDRIPVSVERRAAKTVPAHPVAAAALFAALAALFTFVVATQDVPPKLPLIPKPPAVPVRSVTATPSRHVLRAAFFDAKVEPRIMETDASNRQAAERCIARLRRVFDQYRDGVDPFVEDLTSISTRLGIARRMPAGWWKGDRRVDAYVQNKFETHLFSEATLTRDIAAVLNDFRSEVDANQKRMLVKIRASLSTADLPEIVLDDYGPFSDSVARQLRDHWTQQGTSSVYNALTVLVFSEAGSYAAVSVVSGLLARFGSAAAATAVAAGGATVGASATGAGGGSLAGPVGTVVGLGVGLAIGLAIDWWMTEQFEEKMNQQMNDYLDALERAIVDGDSPASADANSIAFTTTPTQGIAGALPLVCDRLRFAYRERFFDQIVINVEPSP